LLAVGLYALMIAGMLLLATPVFAAEDMDEIRDLAAPDLKLTIPAGKAELLPPLPFTGPQVGPIIKQGFANDVERWTTAFIPRDLDNLTPIEFPETEERWIRVDLSEQVVIAYERDRPVRGFVISSGLPRTPTVTGTYRIRTKVQSQTMTGGNRAAGNYYDLDNVQWVQYFYEDYSFHGTYWHKNFGQPMSHGCLNMTISDAKWLFDWADPQWDGQSVWYRSTADNPGTLVIIHE
jgi:lipoprotein-anchoring transpeptidase ErfK/SrfK